MNKIQFQILKHSGINHLGKLIKEKKEFFTPITWFGLSIIEPLEFQLEVFKKSNIEAFLSNAYDLYYTDKKGERGRLVKQLQKLDLIHKIDSGGFQLMKAEIKGTANKFPLTPKMVLSKQVEVGCDFGVQLDFPFGPNLSKSQKKKRLNKTLENLEQALKLIDHNDADFLLLPVIHTVSNDLELLEYGLREIENISGEVPKFIGVGSLVPLVKSMKGSKKNGIESFIYALITLRKLLPHSFIHAFGIGGTMAYLGILGGIDSYDSNGWIQKAAYGVVQLPGISDRFLKKEDHNRPYLIQGRKPRNSKNIVNEIDMFMKCKCSACQPFYKEIWNESEWKLKQKAFIGRDQSPKILRAIHNVSLYQSEIILMRKAIKNDRLEQFVRKRLRNSIYYKYVNFTKKLESKNIEDLSNFEKLLNSTNKEIADFL
ncbi:hypothetical protein LCGC14_0638330 [marine sediment metagenome]|uniref:tRNA-guanine(15) transglycosylase-like domain-containing protein n=1 Tax=marine sediment metagenome TaxID=412755 RepID=A0A0F9U8A4_9ZZZZ